MLSASANRMKMLARTRWPGVMPLPQQSATTAGRKIRILRDFVGIDSRQNSLDKSRSERYRRRRTVQAARYKLTPVCPHFLRTIAINSLLEHQTASCKLSTSSNVNKGEDLYHYLRWKLLHHGVFHAVRGCRHRMMCVTREKLRKIAHVSRTFSLF